MNPTANERSGQLDRLDQIVGHRPARWRRAPRPSRSSAWWWCERTSARSAPIGPRGERPRLEPDLVGRELADDLHVLGRVAEVLDQRAAAGDVEDLHAAADAEHGHVALERAAAKRDLEAVALGLVADRHRVRLGAVARRVEVGSAREDQRVEDVEKLRRVGGAVAPRPAGAPGSRRPPPRTRE